MSWCERIRERGNEDPVRGEADIIIIVTFGMTDCETSAAERKDGRVRSGSPGGVGREEDSCWPERG